SMHQRHTVTAVVTGKPLNLGGSRGRPEATGRGCRIVTEEGLKRFSMRPEETEVVIQGFGNVGGMAAKLMHAGGFKIVSIIEWDGALYHSNGLDIPKLMEHRKTTGSIVDFPEAEAVDLHEALEQRCDVLLPAARENTITSANAQ